MKLGLTLLLVNVFAVFSAQATVITFSDRALFQAASGSTQTYDFDGDTAGLLPSVNDFGDFSTQTYTGRFGRTGEQSITPGGGLYFDGNFSLTNPLFTITFDEGVTAFGFDFTNTDWSRDFFQINLNGTLFDIGTPRSSGFFGFVLTSGTLSSFNFSDDPFGGGNLDGVLFDNFEYSYNRLWTSSREARPVPVPATLWLTLAGLFVVAAAIYQRYGSRDTSPLQP